MDFLIYKSQIQPKPSTPSFSESKTASNHGTLGPGRGKKFWRRPAGGSEKFEKLPNIRSKYTPFDSALNADSKKVCFVDLKMAVERDISDEAIFGEKK